MILALLLDGVVLLGTAEEHLPSPAVTPCRRTRRALRGRRYAGAVPEVLVLLLLALGSALAAPEAVAREEAHRRLSDPSVQLETERLDWIAGSHVRVRPRLHGLPVRNAGGLVSVDRAERIRATRGLRRLRAARRGTARVPADEAARVAREAAARWGSGELWTPRTEPVYFLADGEEVPRLAWSVAVSTASPPSTWTVTVDAADGSVLEAERTSREARALVYAENPTKTPDLLEAELPGLLPGTSLLEGTYGATTSCLQWDGRGCWTHEPSALADAAGDFVYPPAPGSPDDPAAEVQLYWHLDRVASFYDGGWGFRTDQPLLGVVNFPEANAFYGDVDGDGSADLSFGYVEGRTNFAYDGDVVYHEYGHAIVDELADLPWIAADRFGMQWAGGSLNEGAADLLSMLLTEDPHLGEFAGSGLHGGPIRDLREDRRCPDHIVGEVHEDGKILASLGWNLLSDARVGAELTSHLLQGALPTWDRRTAWADAGASLLDAAAELLAAGVIDGVTHDAVVVHLERAGLLDCGRFVALGDGEAATVLLPSFGLDDELALLPAGTQLAVDVPDDATSLTISLEDFDAPEGLGWSLHVRAGVPVEHEVVRAAGVPLAVPQRYDLRLDGRGTRQLVLDRNSDPPLVAGTTWYLAPASRNLGALPAGETSWGVATVRATAGFARVPAEAEERSTGLGCRTAPASATLLPLVLLLAVTRRPRRRR